LIKDIDQILPGLYKRLGAIVLNLGGQSIDLDATVGELPERNFGVAGICGENRVEVCMVSKSRQSFFGHGIYGEGNCQSFDLISSVHRGAMRAHSRRVPHLARFLASVVLAHLGETLFRARLGIVLCAEVAKKYHVDRARRIELNNRVSEERSGAHNR
jgi:hypothetical protein